METLINKFQKELSITTCSEAVQKGIRWLENEVSFDKNEKKLKNKLEKIESIEDDFAKKWSLNIIERKLKLKYFHNEAGEFYVLSNVNSPLVKDYLRAAENKEFWDDWEMDESDTLWFYVKLVLGENKYLKKIFEDVKSTQQITGRFFEHVNFLRAFIAVEPNSDVTKSAVNYSIKNDTEYSEVEQPIIILALSELDYAKYHGHIKNKIKYLKNEQNSDGSWGDENHREQILEYTSYAIQAISRVNGTQDPSVIKSIKWLKEQQSEDGSWSGFSGDGGTISELVSVNTGLRIDTVDALLALMAVGEGPKVPYEAIEFELNKMGQINRASKPEFVHTSPEYYNKIHIEQIYDSIKDKLASAESEIRIASPYIEMLHDYIINLKSQNPKLSIKIITREKGTQTNKGKKIIDLLNKHTKGECKEDWKIHSRMVIIDNREVLISSSDLNGDGLVDQFNAGVWIKDKEVVKESIKFFDNIWNNSDSDKKDNRNKNANPNPTKINSTAAGN